MKLKHTQKKSSNRPQSLYHMTRGMSQWLRNALFGSKEFSETTKNRGGFNTRKVYAVEGQKLGKQLPRTTNK